MQKLKLLLRVVTSSFFNIALFSVSGAGLGLCLGLILCVFTGGYAPNGTIIIITGILGGFVGIKISLRDAKNENWSDPGYELPEINRKMNEKLRVIKLVDPAKRDWSEIQSDIDNRRATQSNYKQILEFWDEEFDRAADIIKHQACSGKKKLADICVQFLSIRKYSNQASHWLKIIEELPSESEALQTLYNPNKDIQDFRRVLDETAVDDRYRELSTTVSELNDLVGIKYLKSYFDIAESLDFPKFPFVLWKLALQNNTNAYYDFLNIYRLFFDVDSKINGTGSKMMSTDALLSNCYIGKKTNSTLLDDCVKMWIFKFCTKANTAIVNVVANSFISFGLEDYYARLAKAAQMEGLSLDVRDFHDTKEAPLNDEQRLTTLCNFSLLKSDRGNIKNFFDMHIHNGALLDEALVFRAESETFSSFDFPYIWNNNDICEYLKERLKESYETDLIVSLGEFRSNDKSDNEKTYVVVSANGGENITLTDSIFFLICGENVSDTLYIQVYAVLSPKNVSSSKLVTQKMNDIYSQYMSLKENADAKQKLKIDVLIKEIKDLIQNKVLNNDAELF